MAAEGKDGTVPEEEYKPPDVKEYSEYWAKDTVFIKEANECLIQYQEKLLGDAKRLKVFVPLCGRAVELKYFAEMGHEVVGVEFAEIAIHQFFETFNITYETKPMEGPAGTLYTSTTENLTIRIFCCDFFEFGPHLENDFQAVWDAGFLYSLPTLQRGDYVKVIKSVMASTSKTLVMFDVPCLSDDVTTDDLQQMYGKEFTIEYLGYTKTQSKHYEQFCLEGFKMYLISSGDVA
ncbi:thiopurine S-methyltransferase-like [Mizuhopecten yessoensis]|uniref:Thiopurine S-methyltransferase n=1 Tax=Mizuhopecten yessoensis TaxID=6573 RepID=A0A210QZ65_MIZYE|nr:thiopurine S-methyltransferase-like [Mizuhopecten yessoensis]OWF54040.1 Thiopurine S-methyltransferase [Mizuhopecten yessoensis]